MARKNLKKSLELMFGHEGGYVNNPNDKGGPTKFGITHKTLAAYRGVSAVTASQVKALTIEEATKIYEKSYWLQSGGDLLPSGLDYMAFDFGVNSGPSRSIKTLQQTIGLKGSAIDGIVGDQTVKAVNAYSGGIEKLIKDYAEARMKFLRGLTDWKHFGRGWTIRVTGVDPNGQYKKQLGVVGNALILYSQDTTKVAVVNSQKTVDVVQPIEISANETPIAAPVTEALPPEIEQGKGSVANTSLVTIASKPEAWGPLTGLVSGVLSNFTASPILQGALAFGLVVGVLLGAYYFVKRIRKDG